MRLTRAGLPLILAATLTMPSLQAETSASEPWVQNTSADGSSCTARHESAGVAVNGKLYVFGGRGDRPVDVYDPVSNTWHEAADAPMEMHHFQAAAVGSKIYIIGAFTCCYPVEDIIGTIYVFDTVSESWSTAGSMPASRRRGSTATIVRNGKIYLLGGNTNGHSGGAVPWFDEYDPATGTWTTLPDAPNARDHFQAALVGNRLVAAAGRQSAQPSPQANTVGTTDVYDFGTGNWLTRASIPTQRAGTVTVAAGEEAIVLGGEVANTAAALRTVEAYNPLTNLWRTLKPMIDARHGAAGDVIANRLHIVAGNAQRGGGAEISDHETLLVDIGSGPADSDGDGLTDADEIQTHGSDPLDADSDDDGLNDGSEVQGGTSPVNADTDGDGLDDRAELQDQGTDPLDADTDRDNLSDGDEISLHGTNPLLADSDEDGLNDDRELQDGTDPNDADSDDDGLSDSAEVFDHLTDPLDTDSDDDTLDDAAELLAGTDPNDADSDDDLLDDAAELTAGTNPLLADTDEDGLDDNTEVNIGTDPVNPDSDGDGIPDGVDADPLVPHKKSGALGVWLLALLGMLLVMRRQGIRVNYLP